MATSWACRHRSRCCSRFAGFFAIYARPLIDLLYGSAFGDAVLPLRFLAAMTVLYGINAFIAMLMIVRGAAQRIFGDISIARVLVAPTAIAAGVSLTVGAMLACGAAYLVTLLLLESYAFPEDWGFCLRSACKAATRCVPAAV